MNEYLRPDDTRDALRKIGGLLIGLAAAMIYIRKGPFLTRQPGPVGRVPDVPGGRDPGGLSVRGHLDAAPDGRAAPLAGGPQRLRADLRPASRWRSSSIVIGGNPNAPLNVFWIFAVTAGLAFYAGSRAGVRVQFLLGSIAVIISWTALWDKILSGGDRRPLGRLPRAARHPRDRAARGGPVRVAHQPRRRRRGRQRDGARPAISGSGRRPSSSPAPASRR